MIKCGKMIKAGIECGWWTNITMNPRQITEGMCHPILNFLFRVNPLFIVLWLCCLGNGWPDPYLLGESQSGVTIRRRKLLRLPVGPAASFFLYCFLFRALVWGGTLAGIIYLGWHKVDIDFTWQGTKAAIFHCWSCKVVLKSIVPPVPLFLAFG